ncbi:exo-alpha-sialidase [Trypanosoma cruzi]|nr:exo-alpha-sialidase [Trypanosoma cruzi]
MGTTTASPLEKVPCTVGCGAARRFACSPTDRTAQSFHCGHFAGITCCGGVLKSRISEVQAVPPQDCPCCLTGAAPARHGSSAGEQAPECPVTRFIGCSDFHQACSGRAAGVALVVRHTFPCERLSLLEPTAWRPPPSACAHRPAPACTR